MMLHVCEENGLEQRDDKWYGLAHGRLIMEEVTGSLQSDE